MVDGARHVRPHWRGVFGSIFSLGHDILTERAHLLERAFVEEGITAMLPGEQPVNWRCDPIPLILSAKEFAGLEAGLAQRARLIDVAGRDTETPTVLTLAVQGECRLRQAGAGSTVSASDVRAPIAMPEWTVAVRPPHACSAIPCSTGFPV